MSILQLEARSGSWPLWIGPAAAAIAGGLASGATPEPETGLRLLLVVFLVDAIWGSLWAAGCHTDWVDLHERWLRWGQDATAQDQHTPERLGKQPRGGLRPFVAWCRADLWPSAGRQVITLATLGPLSLIVSAALGAQLVLLTVAAVAVIQLTVFSAGSSRNGDPPLSRALLGFILPFLAGLIAFHPPMILPIALALCSGVAYAGLIGIFGGQARSALWVDVGQLLSVPLAVAARQPLAAVGIGLLLTPQLLFQPWLRAGLNGADYSKYAQWPLVAAVLLAAWSVRPG